MSRRVLAVVVLSLAVAGCEDFKKAMEGQTERKPVSPPGVASVEQVEEVGAAAEGGSVERRGLSERSERGQESREGSHRTRRGAGRSEPSARHEPSSHASRHGGSESRQQSTSGRSRTRKSEHRKPSGIIGKTTAKVVDAQRALKNPNIVVVENRLQGNDPLTVAASAYVSMASRASTFGFQRALQLFKATNGRNPTYREFVQMMKENRVEFAALPPYQMYGYDAKTGGIVILEDKAKKIELYKKHGIPIEPQDKKYLKK